MFIKIIEKKKKKAREEDKRKKNGETLNMQGITSTIALNDCGQMNATTQAITKRAKLSQSESTPYICRA